MAKRALTKEKKYQQDLDSDMINAIRAILGLDALYGKKDESPGVWDENTEASNILHNTNNNTLNKRFS